MLDCVAQAIGENAVCGNRSSIDALEEAYVDVLITIVAHQDVQRHKSSSLGHVPTPS